MVEINIVYTKTGDDGKTSLTSDLRLLKSAPRIEAIGAVDELNSQLGLIISHARSSGENSTTKQLTSIQNQLFNLGAELAMMITEDKPASPCIQQCDVEQLENQIDTLNSTLAPLNSFVLPQGNVFISLPCHTQCLPTSRTPLSRITSKRAHKAGIFTVHQSSQRFSVCARTCNTPNRQST